MGSYAITEVKSHPIKTAYMVSFNGAPAEYYEIEPPQTMMDGWQIVPATDAYCAAFIAATLQSVADAAEKK